MAKEALNESTGVRHTRDGDILVELKPGVKGSDVSHKIKEVIWDRVCASSLQSKVYVEVKGIDLLESKEDLKQDIASGLGINDTSVVEIKSLKATP